MENPQSPNLKSSPQPTGPTASISNQSPQTNPNTDLSSQQTTNQIGQAQRINTNQSQPRNKYPLIILMIIIFILITAVGGYLYYTEYYLPSLYKDRAKFYLTDHTPNISTEINSEPLTIGDGLEIAKNIDPYIPPGYDLLYKAKIVEFESGGTLIETRMEKGENRIGILMTPSISLVCETQTSEENGIPYV